MKTSRDIAKENNMTLDELQKIMNYIKDKTNG